MVTIKKPKKQFNSRNETDEFSKTFTCKLKTELCKNWELTGKCFFKNKCSFAHGFLELIKKYNIPENYKTQVCI